MKISQSFEVGLNKNNIKVNPEASKERQPGIIYKCKAKPVDDIIASGKYGGKAMADMGNSVTRFSTLNSRKPIH
jgi:hypothetical protein